MKNESLINELDNATYFIIRSDGLVIRDEFGYPELISAKWDLDHRNTIICNKNNKAKRVFKSSAPTFSMVLVADYKKQNPDFYSKH